MSQTTTYTCRLEKLFAWSERRTEFDVTHIPISSVNTVKNLSAAADNKAVWRSAECSSQQLRASPIEAGAADCTGLASITFQSRAKRRAHKRAFCGLCTSHLRCHFVKSTFVRRVAQRLLCRLRPAACKAFYVTQWRKWEKQSLDFQWFAPAGRRQAHHFILFLMWICSRRNLQHSTPNGDWRASKRERQRVRIGMLAAAIHSVKPRGHPAKREYP